MGGMSAVDKACPPYAGHATPRENHLPYLGAAQVVTDRAGRTISYGQTLALGHWAGSLKGYGRP